MQNMQNVGQSHPKEKCPTQNSNGTPIDSHRTGIEMSLSLILVTHWSRKDIGKPVTTPAHLIQTWG